MNKRQYIEYLIATPGNYTCTNLANHLQGEQAVSHDAITDYLRREKLTPRGLWEVVASLIENTPEAYLIFDDSVQDKRYSKKIEMVKRPIRAVRQYSGAAGGLVDGIGIVNLLHTSGKENDFFPIDYRIYHIEGDGKTKNDHFREMLLRAKSDKGIKARTALFDSWYAGVDNLKLLHRLEMFFVTTLKSNRMVSLSQETGYVHLQQIEWTPEQMEWGLLIKLKELAFLVRLFKIVAKNGDIEWVITNLAPNAKNGSSQTPITTQDVQAVRPVWDANAVRWQIEQMHRELPYGPYGKQLVGTEKCQCRKARSQRNHLSCCYHAWLALRMRARQAKASLYEAKSNLLRDFLMVELRKPTIGAYGIP